MKKSIAAVLIAFSSLAIGCGAAQTAASPASVPVDGASRAPDFSIELTNSETFRLSDHLGKDVIVIDFWATYCVPCISVLRHLEQAHVKYKDKGLVVLAVAIDPPETAGQIGAFVRSRNLTFPVAHDIDSQITNLYNKKSVAPYQVLIGRNGQIIKRRESYQPGDETGMEADIAAALAAQ